MEKWYPGFKFDVFRPTLGQAFIIIIALMVSRIIFGAFINAIEKYAGIEINGTLMDGFAMIFIFGFIFLFAVHFRWRQIPEVYSVKSFKSINFIPIVFSVAGLSILVSELDNGIRHLIPMSKYHSAIHASKVISDAGWSGSLFTIAIVAPITYELFFRGWLLKSFLNKYPLGSAVAYSLLLFALLEGNPWQFTDIILLGTLVSIWFIRFKSVIPCIIGHSIYNLMPVLFFSILKIDVPGYSSNLEARGYQPLWFDLIGLGLMTVSGLLFYAFNRQKKNPIE